MFKKLRRKPKVTPEPKEPVMTLEDFERIVGAMFRTSREANWEKNRKKAEQTENQPENTET
ncbi:MAG: hypothetical protein F4077_01235 [Gammaproteobacteria bacterium]|nr:hypothetical protein [Gammaproteobacteria bacterium]